MEGLITNDIYIYDEFEEVLVFLRNRRLDRRYTNILFS